METDPQTGSSSRADPAGLFYEDLISAYVDGPGKVARDWLSKEVQDRLQRPNCRYVLLTGEPGAGKTGIMAALARANPAWLRYFIRSDSVAPLSSGDAVSFMLRIGHQLALRHPEIFDPELLEIVVQQRVGQAGPNSTVTGVRIEDLKVSPFYRTAIRVQQDVAGISGGLVGVEISQATVEPRLLEPATLGQLALVDPAAGLAQREPDAAIVVLVDALDELLALHGTTTILDWLETGPKLPSNVRFVLTSRPHARLRTLQGVREGEVEILRIEDHGAEVIRDVRAFSTMLLDETGALGRRPAIDPETALAALSRAASGNFAYLSAYARSLRAATASDDSEALDELLAFGKLPDGLNPLYATFVRRIRRQVESLGQLEVASSGGASDAYVQAWEGAGQPILSVLAVARAPLKLDQLMALGALRVWKSAANNVLQCFVPFLDDFGGAWQFFHPSVAEFLRTADADAMPDVAVDAREWNTRVVHHYQGGAAWADVDWPAMDDYGLLHVAEHLGASSPDPTAVSQLVTRGLRAAMKVRFNSDLAFRRVIERARAGAEQAPGLETVLTETVFLGFVLTGLSAGAARLDPAVYGLMARLGRVEEALTRVEVLSPGMMRFRALEAIRGSTPARSRAALGPLDGAELLTGAAVEVPVADGSLFPGVYRNECIRDAAMALAPHSVERALQLANMLKPEDREKERRAVLAAAARAVPEAAAGLIAQMKGGRAAAAAAAAAAAYTPDLRDSLIALTRESLAAAEEAEKVSACAQILALVGAGDPARSGPWEATLNAALDRLPPDQKTSYSGWGRTVAQAARPLHDAFPNLAARILAHCEPEAADSSTDWNVLDIAETWAAWGRKEECTRLLQMALAYYRGLGWYGPARDIARVASIAAKIDPEWGEQLASEGIALVEPVVGTADSFERSRLDGTLSGIIDTLRPWDRARALHVARWLHGNWIPGSPWDAPDGRGSALALIGLDAAYDDPELAAQLLAECLATDDEAALVLGHPDPQRLSGQLFSLDNLAGAAGRMVHAANFVGYISNELNYWSSGREWRVLTSPADVLRSLDFAFFPWATWARAVVAAIGPMAGLDHERAAALAFRSTDPCEILVGLATVAQILDVQGDPHCDQIVRLIDATFQSLPRYAPAIDLDKLQQKPVLLFLDPTVRARFEAAARLPDRLTDLGLILVASTGSWYVELAWRAERMAQQFRSDAAIELLALQARPIIASALDDFTSADPLVGDLARLAFIGALARQDPAAAKAEVPKISHALSRATAELACILASSGHAKSTVTPCLAFLNGLKEEISPLHRAALAATAAGSCGAEDVNELLRWGLKAIEGSEPLMEVRGRMALAGVAPTSEGRALLPRALELCEAIGNPYLRSDALADMLGPVIAGGDRQLIIRLIQRLIRDGWNTWVEALRRTMPQLVVAFGPDFVDRLDLAMRKTQAVLGTDPSGPLNGVSVANPGSNLLAEVESRLPPESEPEQPDQVYLETFLTQADLGPSLRCVQDSRVMSPDPGDHAYRHLGGRQSGLTVWMDSDDKPIWRLVDIRFLFGTAENAATYHRVRLTHNSEGAPPVRGAPLVGEECAVFGGTNAIAETVRIRMTTYCYVFRVGRMIVKLFVAQGHEASENLTPAHLAALAHRIVTKITASLPAQASTP